MDNQTLESLASDQLIVGLALVTPEGRPHNTPVWINYSDGKYYVFTRKWRQKAVLAEKNPDCMISFNNGAVQGVITLVERGTNEYKAIMDLPDTRYGNQPGYDEYKLRWDLALKITPTKVYA
ncbi:MAG: hypothetical protein ACW98K_00550 [Candidatus Kariarchaeaceae archaeon]|jgi:hypothetical protein